VRAHGYSDGHVTSFGWHERKDLRTALGWLRERHPEAAEELIVYGFSMGSAAAIPVAAESPRTLGLIVDSGFGSLTDVAWAMARNVPPGLRQYVYYTALPLASAFCEAPLWRVRPGEAMAELERPVLVMHGGNDQLIPSDAADPLRDHPRATGETLPGAGHTNLPLGGSTYFRRVDEFIERLLDEGSTDAETPDPGQSGSEQPEDPDASEPGKADRDGPSLEARD
jgi:pimeloyl-ACP methyl ester carboxylesterase